MLARPQTPQADWFVEVNSQNQAKPKTDSSVLMVCTVPPPDPEHPTDDVGNVTTCQVRCNTVQHSTAQHSAAQRSAAQRSTAQHSTAQHSTSRGTAQHKHSTVQHSTIRHTVSHHKVVVVADNVM
eukprot:COSAG06_NODE_248_length_19147_cov_105.719656_1_plen_125_part_00